MALKFKKLNISGVEFLLGICSPQFIPSRDLTLTVIIPKIGKQYCTHFKLFNSILQVFT